MDNDPVQESIRTLLELLAEADKEGIKSKRQLTMVLGLDEPETSDIVLVHYLFDTGDTSHRGLMTPMQRDLLKVVVDNNGTPADIRDKIETLLLQVQNLARNLRDQIVNSLAGATAAAVRRAAALGGGTQDKVSCTYDPGECKTDYTKSACSQMPGGQWHLSNTCPPVRPPDDGDGPAP
jgi:hypothetical protein